MAEKAAPMFIPINGSKVLIYWLYLCQLWTLSFIILILFLMHIFIYTEMQLLHLFK